MKIKLIQDLDTYTYMLKLFDLDVNGIPTVRNMDNKTNMYFLYKSYYLKQMRVYSIYSD